MSRYVSFAVLLTVIAFLTIVFFKILSGFLVPLFLAALLVVIFGPLHTWMLERCNGRKKVAAMLTTLAILLVVLIPIGILITMAIVEGKDATTNFRVVHVKNKVREIRTKLGLDFPAATKFREIDETLAELRDFRRIEQLDFNQEYLFLLDVQLKDCFEKYFDWVVDEKIDASPLDPEQVVEQRRLWQSLITKRDEAAELVEKIKAMDEGEGEEQVDENGDPITGQRSEQFTQYYELLGAVHNDFIDLKNNLGGGRLLANLKTVVNPGDEQLSEYSHSVVNFLRSRLLSFGGATTAYVAKMIFGGAIMVIALYFFLLDGASMISACQGLSPLDDDHEQELVDEFRTLSRAVVVATLLSALVQGLLAGIGFYFTGFESIFLMTMLTTALALVPFVGAAAVWIPACLYLYFVQNDITSAIGLAIYGAAIISMADNVIKPMVLHGQSNLHPLVALLSVLGGISALGPVGLLVGPMVVAFLQTMLKLLQRELTSMDTAAPQS